MQILINRSVDTSTFSSAHGSIPFVIIEKGERSNVCGKPMAYVIDTKTEWDNSIAKIIRTDCGGKFFDDSPQPTIDFDKNTAIAFFWGLKNFSANTFSIIKVEGNTENSILISLNFKNGPADALSYPYIIATIPKLSSMKFVFVQEEIT